MSGQIVRRQTLAYTDGIVRLTRPGRLGGRRPSSRSAKLSRSAGRNNERPADITTKGSGSSTSVQPAGTEQTRWSPGFRKNTRCSPQVWVKPTSSYSSPFNGWNG
jgi:hypothetical protein